MSDVSENTEVNEVSPRTVFAVPLDRMVAGAIALAMACGGVGYGIASAHWQQAAHEAIPYHDGAGERLDGLDERTRRIEDAVLKLTIIVERMEEKQ